MVTKAGLTSLLLDLSLAWFLIEVVNKAGLTVGGYTSKERPIVGSFLVLCLPQNNVWRLIVIVIILPFFLSGLSLSWSYGCWIYNYLCSQCLSPLTLWVWILLRRGVLNTTLCDKVSQGLVTGQWFSPGTPVSSTKKTDHHNITEILLKVALNTITLTLLSFSLHRGCNGCWPWVG